MSRFTDIGAHKAINAVFRSDDVFVILFNDPDINDLDAGVITSEINPGGYSRKQVTFGPPSNRSTVNTNNVTFDIATTEWTFTHFGIINDSDELLQWAEMPLMDDGQGGYQPWEVPEGSVLNFPVGNIAIVVQTTE